MCILQVILECIAYPIPSSTSNISNQVFVQCKMHIHYIWIFANSNSLQVYIFTYKCFQCQWVKSVELTLTYKNVAWKIHGWHKTHGKICVLVRKKKCQAKTRPNDHEKCFISTSHLISLLAKWGVIY
jgi:hypothetical protein